ncbi:hypothetical protein IGI04_019669, partial [Brassica rapa subsp. trilocularis]
MSSLKDGSIMALILPKKQHDSLSISSLIRKKQSTHNFIYIIIYIVLTSIIKNISYPKSVVVYLSSLLIKLIINKHLFYSLKETTTTQTIKTPKTRIPKKTKETNTATLEDTRDNPERHKDGNNISTCSLLLSYKNSLHAQCQQANA